MKKLFSNLKSALSTIKYCFKLSWNSSKLYTIIRLIGKIIMPIIMIVNTFLLKFVIDLLEEKGTIQDLIVLVISIFIATIISVIIRKLVTYAESMHNDIIDKYITMNMMDKSLNASLEMFDNPEYYDKLNSVKRDSYATGYILWSALDFVSSTITFVSAMIVLSSINWLYGVLMILAAFPSAIAGQKYTKILYRLGLEQVNDERKKGYLYMISSRKEYAQDIRLFNIGNWVKNRYKNIWDNVFTEKRNKIRSKTILTTTLELLPEVVTSAVMVDISIKVLNSVATIGDFSLYTGLLGQLWASIYMLTHSFMTIYENKLKIDNVKSFEDVKLDNVSEDGIELNTIENIEFKDVSFSYPSSEKLVLNKVSFMINKGDKIAIVGVNGSGKSTLIKLLLRFYEVPNGEILINNININEYSVLSLRKIFSCYFQNTLNYGFTIHENLMLGNLEKVASKDEIINILKSTNAERIINKCENGIDTYLTRQFEETGIELSGGENQKIALARTYYRNADILLLDEPSSSLDPEAEHILFQSLEELAKDKTALFTSHRLSNIQMADKIIVLENGEILEIGSKEELLKNPKRFAQLYQYQADKYSRLNLHTNTP